MTCCEIRQNIEPKKGDPTKTHAIEAKRKNHACYNGGKEKVKQLIKRTRSFVKNSTGTPLDA